MLTLYILLWSLFTGLTGAAIGLASLLLFRMAMGLGQAGAYPTGANVISKWVPFSNRGFASAIVSFGGRMGGSLAPLLTGYLIVAFTPTTLSSLLDSRDVLDPVGLQEQIASASSGAADSQTPSNRIALRLATIIPREALAESDRLQESLNNVIRRRDPFTAAEMEGLSLEKEASRLLKRERADLSQAEVERLNRLVLEGAFPKSIRKVYGAGWRWVMFAYGFVGLAIAAACWSITRNRPAEHPRVNDAELDLIRYGRPKEATSSEALARGLPLGRIVRSRSLWLSCISQCFTNFGWMFLVAWLPVYLERVHKTPVETRAWLVLIPFTVGWAGMLLGGRLTDWLVARVGLRWGRALPMSLTRFVAMGAYLVVLFDVPTWAAVACFSVVAFSTDLGTSSVWAFCQDVGGSHVGSILGWGNMWGNLGAFATPPVLIWLVGDSYSWDRAFLACAAAFFVSGVAAFAIDATVPVAPDKK
jgi:nitrate/nitrite transporter NarK